MKLKDKKITRSEAYGSLSDGSDCDVQLTRTIYQNLLNQSCSDFFFVVIAGRSWLVTCAVIYHSCAFKDADLVDNVLC